MKSEPLDAPWLDEATHTAGSAARPSTSSRAAEIESRQRLAQRKAALRNYSMAKLVYGYLVHGVRIAEQGSVEEKRSRPRSRARSRVRPRA